MDRKYSFTFTQTEADALQSEINRVNKIYEAHTPQREAYLDDERDYVVDVLRDAMRYIRQNIGRANPSNKYLPTVFVRGFNVSPRQVAGTLDRIAGADEAMKEIYLTLPDELQGELRKAYREVDGAFDALKRHVEFVARPLR